MGKNSLIIDCVGTVSQIENKQQTPTLGCGTPNTKISLVQAVLCFRVTRTLLLLAQLNVLTLINK